MFETTPIFKNDVLFFTVAGSIIFSMRAKSSKQPTPAKKETKSSGNIYDVFVKRMFGRIFVFVDFLVNYADPKFVAEINLRKIKPAPTHYIGKTGDERIVDLIFQCPLKDGSGDLMAVIIFEHQSGSLKIVPRKLQKYISAIWDAETKEKKKVLSAPYFIVLRTAKKPHVRKYPKMADSLPKDRDGKPLGMVPEINYDVVDLPAWDFGKLRGGPVLRLAMGMLKKMIEGNGDDFPEAMLPLLEIADEGEQIELSKELLEFVAKAMAAHNRRLDAAMVSKALKPIFRDKERAMIKTIFDEKFLEGRAEGIAEGEAKAVVKFLTTRFRRVPKTISDRVLAIGDSVVLDSLTELAVTCETLDEFAKALK